MTTRTLKSLNATRDSEKGVGGKEQEEPSPGKQLTTSSPVNLADTLYQRQRKSREGTKINDSPQELYARLLCKTNQPTSCFALEKQKVTNLGENTAIKRFWPSITKHVYKKATFIVTLTIQTSQQIPGENRMQRQTSVITLFSSAPLPRNDIETLPIFQTSREASQTWARGCLVTAPHAQDRWKGHILTVCS